MYFERFGSNVLKKRKMEGGSAGRATISKVSDRSGTHVSDFSAAQNDITHPETLKKVIIIILIMIIIKNEVN